MPSRRPHLSAGVPSRGLGSGKHALELEGKKRREHDRAMRDWLQKQAADQQRREQRRARRDNFEELERELAALRADYLLQQRQTQDRERRRVYAQRCQQIIDSLGGNQPIDPNDPMIEIDQMLRRNQGL